MSRLNVTDSCCRDSGIHDILFRFAVRTPASADKLVRPSIQPDPLYEYGTPESMKLLRYYDKR